MRAAVWTSSVLIGLLSCSAARADDYQESIDEGVREFDAGNFVEARALFEQAHALQPNARTLRGLGFCAYELKRYVQATEELSAALTDPRNALTPELAATVHDSLDKARRFVGDLVLTTSPEDSRVVIDGVERSGRRYALDAGEHRVVASAEGYQSRDLNVTITGMHTARAELVLLPRPESAELVSTVQPRRAPAEPSLTERWWFWAALGVIVSGVTVGVLVATSAESGTPNTGTTGITLHAP